MLVPARLRIAGLTSPAHEEAKEVAQMNTNTITMAAKIPSGAIHDAKSGAGGAKVLAVYIVRKGEPLAQAV